MRKGYLSQAGYSLIETMLVVGIMGVVTSIAVIQVGSSKQGLTGDGAMRVVLSQLNQAKQQAIAQRRNMRLTFVGNNSVQIVREEVPGPTLTTISSVPFEGGMQFAQIGALPDVPAPELPSPAATAPYTGGGVAFGPVTQMRFTPDGTFVDQDGVMLNGTVFLALPGTVVLSARAITIFGSTGRVRAFRWDGKAWRVV
jgi:prepilin-type N-terminal cleavage/methylation domain-containing protein